MNRNEMTNLMQKLQKEVNNSKRICFHKSCNEIAVQSHLLQENGILNQIAEGKGKRVFSIEPHLFKQNRTYFHEQGIGDAFSFAGFCNPHDTKIFKEVEVGEIDFKSYRSALLLSYRAQLDERRKKEIGVDTFSRMLRDFQLKLYLNDNNKAKIDYLVKMYSLAVNDSNQYEDFFVKDIEEKTEEGFVFVSFEVPKIPICASSVFTYETSEELDFTYRLQPFSFYSPPTNIYFHLLPLENRSLAILGCLKNQKDKCWSFLNSFQLDEIDKKLQRISDVLLFQIENWLCSPSFYKENLKPIEAKLFELKSIARKYINEREIKSNINLFKNYV